ncbi:helix-turn-helix domain-containing protein [Dyadobacter diqingensis]|uniref:helix-turn-helix domain-containing protein n=1 Tax=Dyadobacter diqingensis TaxID=2938121 RepID=UPI0020C19BCE|nr:AraC family transcriptional regulator [Dyadobacter diqingensis]
MAFVINAADIISFEALPAPKSVTDSIPVKPVTAPGYFHPSVGRINFAHIATPYMQVTDMRFEMHNDSELRDVDSTDTININFFMKGRLDTCFSGLSHELNMRPNYHNLVYSPEGKDVSRIAANQEVEMLHISLQRDFFLSCLDISDTWSDRVIDDLQHNRPFSGNRNNPETTPYMLRLIDSIRNTNETGPMRNLLLQSRILELLALQMEQFRRTVSVHEEIRADEAEKLHLLKNYLDTNFLADLNLTQLSRICLLNEFKVKKGFKLLFNTTVFNYLRKLRMEYAGNLLANCTLSVDEIASILNYEHSQHFSIAFKKYMGVSPSAYQNKGRPVTI